MLRLYVKGQKMLFGAGKMLKGMLKRQVGRCAKKKKVGVLITKIFRIRICLLAKFARRQRIYRLLPKIQHLKHK